MKSRLLLKSTDKSFEKFVSMFQRRIIASSFGLCPIDVLRSFLSTYHSQSCGKCTPCRVGIGQISLLLDDILDGNGSEETIKLIERTAHVVATASDCEIGTNSGELVLFALKEFRDDFISHRAQTRCKGR